MFSGLLKCRLTQGKRAVDLEVRPSHWRKKKPGRLRARATNSNPKIRYQRKLLENVHSR